MSGKTMNPPVLLLGAATLFYGLQIDQPILSLAPAILLEAHRVISLRWKLTSADLKRLAAFSLVLFLLPVIYFVSTASVRIALLQVLQWAPCIFFPMVLVPLYTDVTNRKLADGFLALISRSIQPSTRVPEFSPGYLYFALCLLAGSVAGMQSRMFYPGVFILCAWALWPRRPRYYPGYLWVGLIIMAGAIGYAGHIGLHGLQNLATDTAVEFLSLNATETDPYQKNTNLGHIGTLKFSDRIIMRVKLAEGMQTPYLLHRASYNKYFNNNWFAKNAELTALAPAADRWSFQGGTLTTNTKTIRVSATLNQGKDVLALPQGAYQLQGLSVYEMKRNILGTTRVEGEQEFLQFDIVTDPALSLTAGPTADDLLVPEKESAMLQQIVSELGLRDKDPKNIVATLATYFAERFAYSLYNKESLSESALSDFFLHTHAGHCEYFATGTVLLLRAAGIPARYATGYSVVEYNDLEDIHVVRLRHAHAWTRAYVDGLWRDIDTTPTTWVTIEQDHASIWEPLADLWSWLHYQIVTWNWAGAEQNRNLLWIVILPVLLYLAWRSRHRLVRPNKTRKPLESENPVWPGSDSAYYRVEKRLRENGLGRKPEEPVSNWIGRISALDPVIAALPSLATILWLHYGCRFSSGGLTGPERDALSAQVHAWLVHYEAMLSHNSTIK